MYAKDKAKKSLGVIFLLKCDCAYPFIFMLIKFSVIHGCMTVLECSHKGLEHHQGILPEEGNQEPTIPGKARWKLQEFDGTPLAQFELLAKVNNWS